jgi:hypothetical protein
VMYGLGTAQALKCPVILLAPINGTTLTESRNVWLREAWLYRSTTDPTVALHRVERLRPLIDWALERPDDFLTKRASAVAKNNVFISYSHKDAAVLERVLVHLRPLERMGLVDIWVDTKLSAGSAWRQEIADALKVAKVAILLVSADFLSSDFIVDSELSPLLASAECSGTRIVPVILKHCRFARHPVLGEFQALNDPKHPVTTLPDQEQEAVFDKLAELVENIFKSPRGAA